MLEKKISAYMKEHNNPYSSDVSLPENLDSKNISFYKISSKPTILFLPLGILTAVLIFFSSLTNVDKLLKSRAGELTSDYPEIVSKLLLLHGAGLTIQNAFATILEDYKKKNVHSDNHYIYQEIERTLNKIKSGSPESGSYAEMGKRCQLHSYIKLGTLLEQNIRKGSSDLQNALNYEVKEAFSLHKSNVLSSGEKNGTKMLFPMILILTVVMILIIIPAFLSMNTI